MPDNGYDPDLYGSENQYYHGISGPEPSRASNGLIDFLKGVLVFGATLTGVKMLGRAVQSYGPRIFKSLIEPFPRLQKFLTGVSETSFYRNISATIRTFSDKTNSFVAAQSRPYLDWKERWDLLRNKLNAYRTGEFSAATRNQALDALMSYYPARIADFFRAERLPQRLAGKIVHGSAEFLRESIPIYVADRFLGIFDRDRIGPKPAWYNIPGTIGDYAKFTMNMIPSQIMFGVLGTGMRLAIGGVRAGMIMGARAAGLSRVVPYLPYVDYGVRAVKAGAQAAGAGYTHMQYEYGRVINLIKRGQFVESLQAGLRGLKGSVNHAKKIYKSFIKQEVPRYNWFIEQVAEIEKIPDLAVEDKMYLLRRTIYSRYKSTFNYSKPQSLWNRALERILDIKPATLTDKHIDEIITKLPSHDTQTWVKDFLRYAQKMELPIFDRGIIQQGDKIFDLRNIVPGRLFADFVHQATRSLTIFGFPILETFQTSLLYKSSPPLIHLRSKSRIPVGIGPFSPKGVLEVDQPGAFFSAGRFFVTTVIKNEDGTTQRRLMPATPKDVVFKAFATSYNSTEATIMYNYLGWNEQQMAQYALNRERRNFIANWLDIDQFFSSESIPGMIRDVIRKFFPITRDTISPLYLDEYAEKALTDPSVSQPLTKSVADTIFLILRRNDTYVKRILHNPDVLKKLLGNIEVNSSQQLREVLEQYRAIALSEFEEYAPKLFGRYRISQMLDRLKGDAADRVFEETFARSSMGSVITARQEAMEFIGVVNMLRRMKLRDMDEIFDTLFKDGSINERETASLKLWAKGHFVNRLLSNVERAHEVDVDRAMESAYREVIQSFKDDPNLKTVIKMFFDKPFSRLIVHENKIEHEILEQIYPSHTGFHGFAFIPMQGKLAFHRLDPDEYLKTGNPSGTFTVRLPDLFGNWIANRFVRLAEYFGLGFDPTRYQTGASLLMNGMFMKRILPLAGSITAFGILDRLVDINPLFSGTMLDEGLSMAIADTFVKGDLMMTKLRDLTGITHAAKYAEGLMPGSINSPLMRFARTAGPVWAGAKLGSTFGPMGSFAGMAMGAFFGAIHGFGLADITKSYEEMADIYSGREEVPYRAGRWWLLGSTNWMGSRIQMFVPHWYARMRANYMATSAGLGGPMEQLFYQPVPMLGFNPLTVLVNPHHYAKRHYYSMPAAITGGDAFQEFPIIGPMLNQTVGRFIKPAQMMHEDELKRNLGIDESAYGPQGVYASTAGYGQGPISRFWGGRSTDIRNLTDTTGLRYNLAEQIYNVTEAAGIIGFGAQTLYSKVFGHERPFEKDPVLESANLITSFRRQYWDANLGDPGWTELWRRFIPNFRNANIVSPLINTQPSWMPRKFHIGLPQSKVPMAELVMPGLGGYEATHDVQHTFPMQASMLGLSLPDTVRVMLGLHPHTSEKYSSTAADLERINLQTKAASVVYNQSYDISGTVDASLRVGRKVVLQKIKHLNEAELKEFSGASETDISEMNFYLGERGAKFGQITYVYNGQPILNVPVQFSQERYLRDIQTVREARKIAEKLYEQGLGFGGESYSHIDRLDILANLAPNSPEYKYEEKIVLMQIKAGYNLRDRYMKIRRKRRAIQMGQEFYPRRFLGKVFTPDTEYNLMSLNDNIKAAAEYSLPERMVGSMWELLMSLHTPISTKFFNYRTPLEAYERNYLYGRAVKLWDKPIGHFLESYYRGFRSKKDPFSGALAGSMGGTLIGGPGLGTFLGATVGFAYGLAHGVYRSVTGTEYIPSIIKKDRQFLTFYDQLKYSRAQMLYQITGDPLYENAMRETLTGIRDEDVRQNNWSRIFRAIPSPEKPYFMPFVNEKDPEERERIYSRVPHEVGELLRALWAKQDGYRYNMQMSRDIMMQMPPEDWAGYSPDIPVEDIALRVADQQGLDARNIGLGFHAQVNRLQSQAWMDSVVAELGNPMKQETYMPKPSASDVRMQISNILKQMNWSADVQVTPGLTNTITIIGA